MKAHDDNSPKLDDPRVVEALDEYLAALESGERPDRQVFLARHSEIADALSECLDGIEALHEASSASHPHIGVGAAPGDWQPGTPLGDYRILREIGRGGMGVVYEAEQLSLGRRIALKILPFALTLDPRQLQRFKNEARAAAQLHHQHIVPVYAIGTERGVHFYAMQYIEGQSLAEVIHDLRRATGEGKRLTIGEKERLSSPREIPPTGPYLPEGELPAPDIDTKPIGALATSFSANSNGFYRTVARLGIQAAEALEHAHEYGVIHRDIKPGNLMVDGHGHLWVTDFGLAQFQSDPGLTRSGDLLGTLRYMSPEQANGQRVALDHRTDIYSLGATLYELLTQQPPFEGSDRQTLLHQILNDEPRPPRAIQKSIPVELETIVLKALAKSPGERYATAREMADDLSCFLKDQPIRARRASAVQRLRKWTRRHPSVFWSTVVLFLLTVAGSLVSAEIIRQRTEDRAKEAEDNFKLAQDAVDGMFNLCEEEMAGKPFLDGLRRRFLEDYFLVYYQKLIDRQSDNPKKQEQLADARARVVDILDKLYEIQGLMQYHLLKRDDIAAELVFTFDQVKELRLLEDGMKKRRWASLNLSAQERFVRFSEDARWMRIMVKDILTPAQLKRLREIDLQSKGARAFEEQEVIETLHLKAEQRAAIRTILAQEFSTTLPGFQSCPMEECEGDRPDGPPREPPPGFEGKPPRGKHDGPPPWDRSRDSRKELGKKPPMEKHKGFKFQDRQDPPSLEIGDKSPSFDAVERIVSRVLDAAQQKQWQELIGRPFAFQRFGRVPGGRGGHPGRP